ncbi:diguanylate phosphodiesterase, partial [Erwiniaceae bacterium L1_54_6]|jgi:blue light- and temperature-responsive anti-repressor|nr:diguanylate phosphodiesterase [Erwiniaceae bacterium L1_54_6]
MLTTVIYRSHIADDVPISILPGMVGKASALNASHHVTGILLFNGTHFFQILEGPEEGVLAVYERIRADRRHHNIVELMRDYAPSRRFGNAGMELFDLRDHDRASLLQAVLDRGTSRYRLTYDDRGLQFLRTFVEAREKENYFEIPPARSWDFIPDRTGENDLQPAGHGVVFHPVIDPLGRKVTALEAVPVDCPDEQVSEPGVHIADLNAVRRALVQAGKTCPEHLPVYVSLLPMTLVAVPDAVRILIEEIRQAALVPEQIIIGFSETQVIPDADAFSAAVRQLKASGIGLSIDNFGDGSAGLSVLTRIQPDRIRIDAAIIRDIHLSGPRQAVVQSIIRCCSALEITVIAAGIACAEEWMWLEAAGVINFQGSLFTANGTAVAWPEYREAG